MDKTSLHEKSPNKKFVVEWKGQNYLMLPIPPSTNAIPCSHKIQIMKSEDLQNQQFSETIGSAKFMSPVPNGQ